MKPSYVVPLVGYRMQVQTYTGPAGDSITDIQLSAESWALVDKATHDIGVWVQSAALTAETIERARGCPPR